MWSSFVVIAMTAVAGAYIMFGQQHASSADQALASSLADSMGVYRAAVVEYFRQHPEQYQSVDMATLKESGVLPQWSKLYGQSQTAPWANYRDANGMVYIYAASRTAVNIVADVAKQSQNSIFAGVYHNGDTSLYSPVLGQTGIALPASAGTIIPDGSPVWVAVSR